jgi:fatty-acyl-CoA synthase
MTTLDTSYFHLGGEVPLLGENIPQWFSRIVGLNADQPAVISRPQAERISYAELSHRIDLVARGLLGLGFNKGSRIGIWSTNNIQWLLLQMATARIGAVLVNINPAYRSQELAYALQCSQVQGLFLIPAFRKSDYVQALTELIPELKQKREESAGSTRFPFLSKVVLYDPREPTGTRSPAAGMLVWNDLLQAADSISVQQLNSATDEVDRDDPANIQYTSGTTGLPKAVVLSHHSILNNAWFAARIMGMTSGERLCVAVPFYHCFGTVLSNLLCLVSGACLVIPCEHFDPLQVLKAIHEERCTAIHGVPTMFIAELDHPRFGEFDLVSLRTGIIAGAPCPPELMQRIIEQMHCREILIGYGQTEASPLTHLTRPDSSFRQRTETVGINLPHQEVKVVSTESAATQPINRTGEICFRGYHLMQGYYGDSEATAKAIDRAGWLHSGDLGVMEPDGYLRITGRLKEMIIRGGENIYPREIEDLLFTHPAVASAAVFGVPDPFYGEQIAAWIQLHEFNAVDEDEIRRFCSHNLAHFKIPHYIRFVQEFPMTVTGKLQKYRMRELMLEELNIKEYR